jgi:hypothetical protein
VTSLDADWGDRTCAPVYGMKMVQMYGWKCEIRINGSIRCFDLTMILEGNQWILMLNFATKLCFTPKVEFRSTISSLGNSF